VDTLVLHTTEGGSIEGAVEWWRREDVVASAHYVVDGKRIVQNVYENLAAFHAGNARMNRRSIGVEVVGHCADPKMWTPEVMAQLIVVARFICREHGIPILHQPGPGICGHADVPDPYNPNRYGGASHHSDPGDHFPWEQFLNALQAPPAAPETAT
jgi:N-acetyl-anhydromuramyl-L-alanine amidase AmpD